MNKTISIIGSGFSSLAASCYLAQEGYNVAIYEKNSTIGGRARQFSKNGFTFDMGPTWYWMPDVFERFFNDFNKKPSDYYSLERLAPSYRVYFGKDDYVDISDSVDEIRESFESLETGSSKQLDIFLKKAKSNYDVAIKDLVYKPGLSILELVSRKTMFELPQFISTIHDVARKSFKVRN